MKPVLRVLMGATALMLAFLLTPGPMSAQKGKPPAPTTTELWADFRDAPGDGIHSNNTGPFSSNGDTASYPNNVILAKDSGTLYMKIQQNQRVFFDFNPLNLIRSWENDSGRVACRAWSPTNTGAEFFYDLPGFLSTGGRPNNDFTLITTGGSFVENNGVWSFNSAWLDLRTLAGVAYVAMNVRFDIPEQPEPFGVMFGDKIWTTDYAGPTNGTWTGIVEVTRTSGTSWYIQPIPVDHPIAIARGLQQDQASLYMVGERDRKTHGNCDLGEWRMPFGLSLWVR